MEWRKKANVCFTIKKFIVYLTKLFRFVHAWPAAAAGRYYEIVLVFFVVRNSTESVRVITWRLSLMRFDTRWPIYCLLQSTVPFVAFQHNKVARPCTVDTILIRLNCGIDGAMEAPGSRWKCIIQWIPIRARISHHVGGYGSRIRTWGDTYVEPRKFAILNW